MKFGREMDVAIARKLFQYVVIHDSEKDDVFLSTVDLTKQWPVPKYSTKVEDSHIIVKKMSDSGFQFIIESRVDDNGSLYWRTAFHKQPPIIFLEGKTLPHAVCLAAMFHVAPELIKPGTF